MCRQREDVFIIPPADPLRKQNRKNFCEKIGVKKFCEKIGVHKK